VYDYLYAFGALVLLCVAALCWQNGKKVSNQIMKDAEADRETAYQLTLNGLSADSRRNLARLVLTLANQGPYRYGTNLMAETIPNTYPLINAMQRAVHSEFGWLFSSRVIIDKMSGNETLKPPTNDEYDKMIDKLYVHKDFLVAAVNHSDKLRAVLNFLDSPECDIEKRIPTELSLSMPDVTTLERICREVYGTLLQDS
jgi:hypothetical protein